MPFIPAPGPPSILSLSLPLSRSLSLLPIIPSLRIHLSSLFVVVVVAVAVVFWILRPRSPALSLPRPESRAPDDPLRPLVCSVAAVQIPARRTAPSNAHLTSQASLPLPGHLRAATSPRASFAVHLRLKTPARLAFDICFNRTTTRPLPRCHWPNHTPRPVQ
ncbi:uncharacterized protein IWZ02DRAFT_210898 [Phyllosticta citriasiana]|uniref:uncharacterized protein n=1 Tax=Phyllosticta citriasiana TaxID=595635 RepID=UPI0030FD4080